ncbi:hypothetical protein [Cylindrospermum sp. FACHB-282]|uniref:hypothetical protein n=1 Tax=Cylindrospermum sp. FACHB-282 TaxID=2692794 RepID=UPI001687BB52|nr:hypothetical protein [Cylindrospermum sp. FACHB-282]MBD2387578.1 hypothetical protein [Cylindrospermum sp. FACHB-282]
MTHFNFKSLAFYGVAISSVLILFKAVTAYGENNLKTATSINSRYRLTLTENLPNCEKSNALTLNIQQSGIYLNASLLPANTNADTEQKLPLSGLLRDQQLSLSGKVDKSILCNDPQSQQEPINSITIQIPLVDKVSILGQLTVNGISKPLEFTAVPQTNKEKSPKSTSH